MRGYVFPFATVGLFLMLTMLTTLVIVPTTGSSSPLPCEMRTHVDVFFYLEPFTGPGLVLQAMIDAYVEKRGNNITLTLHQVDVPDTAGFSAMSGGPGSVSLQPTTGLVRVPGFMDDRFESLESIWSESGMREDSTKVAASLATSVSNVKRAIPVAAGAHLCVASRPVLATLGLPPPNTWSEMMALCSALSTSGLDVACLGHGFSYLLPPTAYIDYLLVRMYGGEFYKAFLAGAIPFHDPRVVDALNILVNDVVLPGYMPLSPATLQLTQISDFAQGRVAIMCTFEVAAVTAYVQGIPENETIPFPFPTYDGPRAVPVSQDVLDSKAELGFVATLGVPKTALHKEIGLDFLAYVASYEAQAATNHLLFTDMPVRKSLTGNVTSPRQQVVAEAIGQADDLLDRTFGMTGDVRISVPWSIGITELQSLPPSSSTSSRMVHPSVEALVESMEELRIRYVLAQVATPVFDPPGGTYDEPIDVVISTATPGAVVFYTLDGSPPSVNASVFTSSISLRVDGVRTLRAFAIAEGLSASSVASSDYTLSLPSPVRSGSDGDDSKTTAVVLAVVLPLLFLMVVGGGVALYVIHRRKTVTYRLASDAKLLIRPEDLLLGQVVGEGAFGTVYSGTWRSTRVAVKQSHRRELEGKDLRDFVSEAQVLVGLRHPTILTFMGVMIEPPSIVTEFMVRGSLYDVLHQPDTFLHPTILFKWAHSLADGLHFLADSGIVHGDFKSHNVLFDTMWTAKICDFGLSFNSTPVSPFVPNNMSSGKGKGGRKGRRVGPGGGEVDADVEMGGNGNVGTLFWSSPEVLEGRAQSAESDAYALGVTLWEMATRRDVYAGENPLAVATKVRTGYRPPLESVPESMGVLVPIMTSLWAQDPKDRMGLQVALGELASLYSETELVFPSPASAPSGTMSVVVVEWEETVERMMASPYSVEENGKALAGEMEGVEEVGRELGGRVVDRGYARLVFGFHAEPDALAFAERAQEDAQTGGEGEGEGEGGGRVVYWATGGIGTREDEYGVKRLVGEVMEDIAGQREQRRRMGGVGLGGMGGLLVGVKEVAEMIERAEGEPMMRTYSRMYCSSYEGKAVVVKKLLKQTYSPSELAHIVAVTVRAVALARHSGQETNDLAISNGLMVAPVALCVEPPHVSLIIPRFSSGSLQDIMDVQQEQGTTMSLSDIRGVLLHVAEILADAHSACRVGHGALKPSNILLEKRGHGVGGVGARVADFGFSSIRNNMGTMTMIPTVAYLAPESLQGVEDSTTADVFVLGTLLYELVVGEQAFQGLNALEVGFRILSGFRPGVGAGATTTTGTGTGTGTGTTTNSSSNNNNVWGGVPDRIQALLVQCWESDPGARPSMADVADVLRSWQV